MADKRIQDLTPASSVQTSDRFVLEQSGQAKSLTGQILINDLAAFLDGHGGINDISYTPPSTGSLDGTLTITLADGTTESFEVENGRGIADISFVESSGLVDTYQITYNDDSEPTTFTVTNGAKGDPGDNWYVHIKWSATEPTQDSDMSDSPDNWIGIYSGLGATAPTSYTEYTWFEYKGETGDTGNGIESISLYSSSGVIDTYRVLFTNGSSTTFEVTNGSNISSIAKTSSAGLTDTYTVTLTNGDTTNFTVSNAKSITTITPPGNPGLPGQTDRYIINFNNGDATFFDVYNGTNGTGSVSLVDNIAPVGGSVPLLTFGNGAPTVDTPGSVKSRYFDTLNNQLYICVAVDEESTPNTYTWRGSSVTVDSVLSTTSTNPVQNAVLTAIIGTTPLDTTAQTLTEAVNEILNDISGLADNIAEEYDPTATYAVGDLCIYDNTLYRCNTAIATPEAWNSIHWTQTSVDDELDTIANDLDTAVTGINSTIGNTTLPTTAQTLTGAIAEHENDISGLSSSLSSLSSTVSELPGSANPKADGTVAVGTSTKFARQDHVHPLNVASSGSPSMDGTAARGSATTYARFDHVHPSDTSKVDISGDTMTGNLTIQDTSPGVYGKNSAMDSSSSSYTANNSVGFRMTEKNSRLVALYTDRYLTDGSTGAWISGYKYVSGSNVANSLYLLVDKNGNRVISVTDSAPWRKGLELTYAANDTMAITSSMMINGIVSSTTQLYFDCVVEKSMENISSISATAMTGTLQGVSGAIEGGSNVNFVSGSAYTISCTKQGTRHVRVGLKKSSNFTNAVGGTPCCYFGTLTLKFT